MMVVTKLHYYQIPYVCVHSYNVVVLGNLKIVTHEYESQAMDWERKRKKGIVILVRQPEICDFNKRF